MWFPTLFPEEALQLAHWIFCQNKGSVWFWLSCILQPHSCDIAILQHQESYIIYNLMYTCITYIYNSERTPVIWHTHLTHSHRKMWQHITWKLNWVVFLIELELSKIHKVMSKNTHSSHKHSWLCLWNQGYLNRKY